MIEKTLKLIPNNIKVSDNNPPDPRLTYIITEYNKYADQGIVPPLTNDTTFGEIKQQLKTMENDSVHLSMIIEFLFRYDQQFIQGNQLLPPIDPELEEKRWRINLKTIIVPALLVVIISLLYILITYAIYKGTLDPNDLLSKMIDHIFNLVGGIMGSPD